MSTMDTRISCHSCHTTEISKKYIPLANGGYHIKATCTSCGRFIRFLAHDSPRLHFGKHRGETVVEVASKDLSYLQWCLREGVVKNARLKSAVEEAAR